MKRLKLITLIIIICTISAQAQSFGDILKELNLPFYKINQKATINEYTNRRNGLISVYSRLDKNELFSESKLYYDELDELKDFYFDFKKDKKNKNINLVLDILRKNFGKEKDVKYEDILTTVNYYFEQGNQRIRLVQSAGVLPSSIEFYEVGNYKVIIDYDEFNKATTIKPINVQTQFLTNDRQLSYQVEFSGIVESKIAFMKISCRSEDWRFIKSVQILLDDASVTTLELKTKRDIVNDIIGRNSNEIGITDISESLCKSMLNSKVVKIRIIGDKQTGDLTINSPLKGLEIVSNRIFK